MKPPGNFTYMETHRQQFVLASARGAAGASALLASSHPWTPGQVNSHLNSLFESCTSYRGCLVFWNHEFFADMVPLGSGLVHYWSRDLYDVYVPEWRRPRYPITHRIRALWHNALLVARTRGRRCITRANPPCHGGPLRLSWIHSLCGSPGRTDDIACTCSPSPSPPLPPCHTIWSLQS